MNTLDEFSIIEQFFNRGVNNPTHFPLGIGDDAAIISTPAGFELATSIDTLVAGTHFPDGSDPADIGYKSLAVSLSDLAAMGAEPAAVLLALTLPQPETQWLTKFANSFFDLAQQYKVDLIGGNLTRGPLSISTVTYGWVPFNQALRRSGAKPGDHIYITGTLGDAGLALQQIQQNVAKLVPELNQRFFRPEPRVKAGLALRGLATAAIDISDGLAADLAKLLHASGAGGSIHTSSLPVSQVMREQCPESQATLLALTAGEDYELCFTAPADAQAAIEKIFLNLDCSAHCIGSVTATSGLKIYTADGKLLNVTTPGYRHF